MSVTSAICLLIVAAVIASSLRRGVDALSPARVFTVIWSVAVGLADLKLSYYQHAWSFYAWSVLLLGVLAFLLGIFIVAMTSIGKPVHTPGSLRKHFSQVRINERGLFYSIIILFVLFLGCYLVETYLAGGLPLFSSKPDQARIAFGVFGLHLIVNAAPALLFLVVEYFLFVPDHKAEKFLLGSVFALTLITFFMLLQRFPILMGIVMVFAMLYYAYRNFRARYFIVVMAVFFALLFFIQSLRIVHYAQNYLYIVSDMKYSLAYAPVTEPYMYIVMNLENFARGAERLNHFAYGYFTGDFIMALTGLKHWMAEYFSLVERPFLNSGYNTFPFLWPFYLDFGVPGVVLLALTTGISIGYTYYTLIRRPSLTRLILYSFSFYFLIISFFTNPLTMLVTVFNLSVILVLQRFVIRERTS